MFVQRVQILRKNPCIHPRAGNQAQPVVHDGVIYIATGENDVFAVSVDTGEILWEYQADIGDDARPCCGWAVRGVGLGEGKVFVGRLDAKLVTLNQQTGAVEWEIQAQLPADGFSITSAPLYYNGMVITGYSGGDLGIRGRVTAYDAQDGAEIWTFYTVPGPGELGHDTWPQEGEYKDVWRYGGASVWQTPAIDPELDMLYFSTSNPGPVLNGYMREGDNLFSASIVAIDVNNGKIFTPYTDEPHPWKPLAAVNWTPSSWSPQTRLMYICATVSTFLHDSTQYVAVLAGGTNLAPTKKSDGLWLFSLNGTTESLPRGSADPMQAVKRNAMYNFRKAAIRILPAAKTYSPPPASSATGKMEWEDCMAAWH